MLETDEIKDEVLRLLAEVERRVVGRWRRRVAELVCFGRQRYRALEGEGEAFGEPEVSQISLHPCLTSQRVPTHDIVRLDGEYRDWALVGGA